MKLLVLPYSEVCMHMRVAGTQMLGELVEDGRMVQLYKPDGEPFSFPITRGEAGWDHQERRVWQYWSPDTGPMWQPGPVKQSEKEAYALLAELGIKAHLALLKENSHGV